VAVITKQIHPICGLSGKEKDTIRRFCVCVAGKRPVQDSLPMVGVARFAILAHVKQTQNIIILPIRYLRTPNGGAMHPNQKSEKSSHQRPNRQRLLSLTETCQYLGNLPKKTLYNRSSRKSRNPFPVRPKRIGTRLFWDIRELDAYIDSL